MLTSEENFWTMSQSAVTASLENVFLEKQNKYVSVGKVYCQCDY